MLGEFLQLGIRLRQCWYCKEPWNREHRCRQGRTLHILQEIDDDTVQLEEQETPPTPDQAYNTAPNTPEHPEQKSEVMLISCHAVAGTGGPATFSLLINMGGHQAVALVDSGSSHFY